MRGATSWVLRQWPVLISVLLASVTLSGAVGMYPRVSIFSDALDYSAAAQRIVSHGVLHRGGADPDENLTPNANITPAYPLFLSAFYLAGPEDGSFADKARAVHPWILGAQLILAILTVGVISACGCALGGSGLGLLTGVLAALYLPFGWSSSVALNETLGTFLLASQLLIALYLVETQRAKRWALPVAFGLTAALTALTRPAYVLWSGVPFIFLFASRRLPARQVARTVALTAIAFVVLMSPWWIRNVVSLHKFIPLSSNTGMPLLDSTGTRTLSPAEQVRYDEAEKQGLNGAGVVARDRLREAWRTDSLGLLRARASGALAVVRWPFVAPLGVYGYVEDHRSLPSGSISFGSDESRVPEGLASAFSRMIDYQRLLVVLAPFSLLFIRRWPRVALVASVPAYTVLVHVPILFLSRYFFPAMPAVILLAAVTLSGGVLLACRAIAAGRKRWMPEHATFTMVGLRSAVVGWFTHGSHARARRALLVTLLVCLGWLFAKSVMTPEKTLVVTLNSNRPVTGSISCTSWIPWMGTTVSINPENVSVGTASSRDLTLTITPLGRVNQRSKGAEVWLLQVSSDAEVLGEGQWNDHPLPESWRREGRALVNASGDSEPLEIGLRAGGYIDVKLLSHPFSGGVRVSAEGQSRDVDLYASRGGESTFRVLLPVPLESSQRVEALLPPSTRDITLTLSGGPRTVRFQGAEWLASVPWSWSPDSGESLELGQGVHALSTDEDGVLVETSGGSANVTFPSVQRWPYLLPRPVDLLFLGLLAVASIGAMRELGIRAEDSPEPVSSEIAPH